MHLKDYDRIVVLCVDRRYHAQKSRIENMLGGLSFEWFIDGEGVILPGEMYDQITLSVPSSYSHGKGSYAHFRAVQAIVTKSWEEGVESLLLIEDDCYFTDNFHEVVSLATQQINEREIMWDLLYMGVNNTWSPTTVVGPNLLKLCGGLTTHCVGIKRGIFRDIIGLPVQGVIDTSFANILHPTRECYAVWPNVARQLPGYSYLSGKEVDYDHYFDSMGSNH